MAVLLDNFITAASKIEFEERLQAADLRHREQAPLRPLLFLLLHSFFLSLYHFSCLTLPQKIRIIFGSFSSQLPTSTPLPPFLSFEVASLPV